MGQDTFFEAAAAIVVVLLIALISGSKWITTRDEQRDEKLVSAALVGLTAIGVIAVLLAAVAGPHPG